MRSPEVIIVGGGVIGSAVAYELARRSVRVMLLDKSLPGRASSASAGGLWPVGEAVGLGCGVIYHSTQAGENGDVQDVGMLPEVFRDFLVESNALFPELAAELASTTGIDVEYREGAGLLFVIYNEQERCFVEKVIAALPRSCDVEVLSPAATAQVEPELTGDLIGAAMLKGEHQINPMLLAEAFKRGAIAHGAEFRHDCLVNGLVRRGDRIAGVRLGEEVIEAGLVINAAGSWAGRLAATAGMELPVSPVRGQIVLTQALPRTLNACLSTSGCYLAQKHHGEVLIGSTTEHVGFDVGLTDTAVRGMCEAAVRAVPMLAGVGIKRMWAGLRPGTPDELPILGSAPGVEGYLNAAGGFRTGIVASALTGRVVAQLATGEPLDFGIEPFGVERFASSAAGVALESAGGE